MKAQVWKKLMVTLALALVVTSSAVMPVSIHADYSENQKDTYGGYHMPQPLRDGWPNGDIT